MRTIWKYPCGLDTFELIMPEGAEVIAFGNQGGQISLWAIVDDAHTLEPRGFMIVGTGHKAPPEWEGRYIGTCQELGGALVWHLFEFKKEGE